MSHKVRGHLLGTLFAVGGLALTIDTWSSALHKGYFSAKEGLFGPLLTFVGAAIFLAPEAFSHFAETPLRRGENRLWRILPWSGRVLVITGFAAGLLNLYLLTR